MPEKSNQTSLQNPAPDTTLHLNSSPVCYADSPEIRPDYRLEDTSEPDTLCTEQEQTKP